MQSPAPIVALSGTAKRAQSSSRVRRAARGNSRANAHISAGRKASGRIHPMPVNDAQNEDATASKIAPISRAR